MSLSDDPGVASQKASAGQPVVLCVQGADLDFAGKPIPSTLTSWVEADSALLNGPQFTALRFCVRLDQSGGKTVVLRSVEFNYRR